MPMTRLVWSDLEQIVADTVWEVYATHKDEDRRKNCTKMRSAEKELISLKTYDVTAIGVVYALWYHLMRVDNIYVALNRLAAGMPHDEENLRLHPNMHVLDVGSGTGSGAMAISYWLATIKNEMPSRQEIACVEPSRQMRRMASKILKTYYERLHGSLSFAQPVSPFAWKHWIRGGTAQCLHETPSKTFDMILFSHTFHEMDQMQQRAELAHLLHIAQWLTETGILLFLTPTKKNLGNEYAKIQFMHKIARVLTAAGMHHIELESVNAKESAAPERRQLPIIEVRKRLNAECERLGVPFAFNNSDYWRARQPYYGLYCRIDAFTWAKW